MNDSGGIEVQNQVSQISTDDLITIRPDALATEALLVMRRAGIHHLPVTDGDKVVGMLTDRHILDRVDPGGQPVLDTGLTVGALMARDVPVVDEVTGVRAALDLMLERKLSGLPLVRNGKVVGIVTESDMLRVLHNLLAPKADLESVVSRGEAMLATPWVQSLSRALADLGI
jgi:acetoin utilization protein AcuB